MYTQILRIITLILLRCAIIVQQYTNRNRRMTLLGILVFSSMTMVFVGIARNQPIPGPPVNFSRPLPTNFDDIKIDQNLHLEKRIRSNIRSLAANEKDKNWLQEIQKFLMHVSPHFQNRSICSTYWGVIAEFVETVVETAERLPNWCIVVVFEWQENIPKFPENVFVLNGTIQYELSKISVFYKESLRLPKGLYSAQKNLGYLWAIFHEATMIWDFDNIGERTVNRSVLSPPLNETIEVLTLPNHNSTVFNPYSVFRSNYEHMCSRGYPFQPFKDSLKQNTPVQTLQGVWPAKNLALIHSLTEAYAEVGHASFLFVKPNLPLHLKNASNDTNNDVKLIIPRRMFSPYDQQTTLHFRSALWALFLPVTVPQQVTDVYRSYMMQRLMWDVNLQIGLVGSFLERRPTGPGAEHTPLHVRKGEGTRQTEKVLFWKIDNLIQFLTQWLTNQANLIGRTEQLFIALYEHGFIKMYDVYLLQLWLQELYQIGYIFPEIVP